MTKIQNIEVCNQIIALLNQNKFLVLSLNADQTKALYEITSNSHHIDSQHVNVLTVAMWQRSSQNKGCSIEVNDGNFDAIYQMLASYIEKHDLVKEPLEYRRKHGIYEVGDWVVVLTNGLGNKYTWSVKSIDGIMIEISQLGQPSEWVHYLEIAHATDEEIKAGYRL